MMPDWKKEISERVKPLRLAPTREAEIVEELAQYLECCYEELLAGGTTEADARHKTLAQLNESDLLPSTCKSAGGVLRLFRSTGP